MCLEPVAANAAYSRAKEYSGDLDDNYQLKNGGVLTDVESSSMSVSIFLYWVHNINTVSVSFCST
jgi:hypothetical protein